MNTTREDVAALGRYMLSSGTMGHRRLDDDVFQVPIVGYAAGLLAWFLSSVLHLHLQREMFASPCLEIFETRQDEACAD
jgi:hypothetical protein